MAKAIRHPDPDKGGRGKKATTSGEFGPVAQQRLSDARLVAAMWDDVIDVVADHPPIVSRTHPTVWLDR